MKVATPAVAALERRGIAYSLHEYVHDPAVASYGDEAVAALGVEGTRVFKTLVAEAAGQLVVAVVPVPAHLDLKALAASVGAKRAAMADPAAAERSSGYVVGAISPIGHKRPLTTVVDATALGFATVFCSAGRRGLELELDPADLVRATDARTAPVARW